MELNGVNSANFYNFNFQDKIVKPQDKGSITAINKPVDPVENIEVATSSISSSIKESINNISLIQQTQKTLRQQSSLIEQLTVITNNTDNINSNSIEINDIFKQYNNASRKVYTNLHELIEEQKSDKSHSYFDGVLGSIPISIEEINKASAKQKEIIAETNSKLETVLEKESAYSKKIIESQKNEKYNSFNEKEFAEPVLKDLSLGLMHSAPAQDRSFSITV